MEPKKKIIIGVVSVLMLFLLFISFKLFVFSSSDDKDSKSIIRLNSPKVDEKKIDVTSKKEMYDREITEPLSKEMIDSVALDKEENDVINPFTNNDSDSEILKEEEGEIYIDEESIKNNYLKQYEKDIESIEYLQREMQKQANSYINNSSYKSNSPTEEELINMFIKQETTTKTNTQKKPLYRDKIRNKEKAKTDQFFHGITGGNNKSKNLVPVETIDKYILIDNNTIALRLKKSEYIEELDLIIPKNAVLYGKISFAGDFRMELDINSYMTNDEIHFLNAEVYDYDGREGINLLNRSWTKIPANVAKDVYTFAMRKAQQTGGLGVRDNTINPDELKRVAMISSAKEIAREIFEKKRIYLPEKYQLWINLNN